MNSLSEASQLELLTRELSSRFGSDRALTIQEIGHLLGHSSRRDTEAFLQLHIGDLPFCVVAGSSGLFRPRHAEDINHYRQSNLSRIRCLAIRNRIIAQSATREGWRREGRSFVDIPRQGDLFPCQKKQLPI